MEKNKITKLFKIFKESSHHQQEIEFWYARDLQKLLGYSNWQNFFKIIEKAQIACKNSKQDILNHFTEVNKMVELGSGSKRKIQDFKLTRYACYLIAQNGDPRKEIIAFAQSYFAIQTRKQELIEERLKLIERISARQKLIETETELSKNLYERGVNEHGFARIRSKGDKALFGGHNTSQMKNKLQIPKNKPLADHLPTITIKAKDLATEMTNFNTKEKDLHGEPKITTEHVQNNLEVRNVLVQRGIKPEELPVEEDIKKIEKKLKNNNIKQLTNDTNYCD